MPGLALTDYAQSAGETQSKPLPYLEIYEQYFSSFRDKPAKILEIGVADGKSMKMWSECFPLATVVGIDLFPPQIELPGVHIYQGAQNDTVFLARVAEEMAPEGFDFIVDDAAHIGELAKVSFQFLFERYLKPGSVYVLEDWGTGYWGNHVYYPDGRYFHPRDDRTLLHRAARKLLRNAPVEWPKLNFFQKLLRRHQYTTRFKSHEHGMPGFIKQLIDEVARADYTHTEHGQPPMQPSTISSVLVAAGVTLVTKAKA